MCVCVCVCVYIYIYIYIYIRYVYIEHIHAHTKWEQSNLLQTKKNSQSKETSSDRNVVWLNQSNIQLFYIMGSLLYFFYFSEKKEKKTFLMRIIYDFSLRTK